MSGNSRGVTTSQPKPAEDTQPQYFSIPSYQKYDTCDEEPFIERTSQLGLQNGPTDVICPLCGANTTTRIYRVPNLTFFSAYVLNLCGAIGLNSKGTDQMEVKHFCPDCMKYIGSYKPA